MKMGGALDVIYTLPIGKHGLLQRGLLRFIPHAVGVFTQTPFSKEMTVHRQFCLGLKRLGRYL